MFSVVMNHAADDPLPPFTSQKAALLTTKIAARSRNGRSKRDGSTQSSARRYVANRRRATRHRPPQWAQVATPLPRSNFLCTDKKGHVEINRPKV